jgi:hypothetical protein
MRLATVLTGLVLTLSPLAAAAQGADRPIPGDSDWTLVSVPDGGCYARLPGRDVDTMVMVNRYAKPVISIGRRDWNFSAGDIAVGLSIDMGPVRHLIGSPVANIILVAIDDSLRNEVLGAKSMTWTLPNGSYSAPVAGLGKAFQAVVPCGLAAAQAAPPPS